MYVKPSTRLLAALGLLKESRFLTWDVLHNEELNERFVQLIDKLDSHAQTLIKKGEESDDA